MGLSVTGLDANGRVTPKGTNVIIPPESAGIGDLVYKSSGGAFKVVGRGTANSSSITVSSVTYSLYGCIYGFIAGMAMVVAPSETSAYWATSNSPTLPTGTPIIGPGTVLMRNGEKASYYAQMNTAQNSNYITGGSSAPVTLSSAYQATSLSSSTFATGASADVKNKYGTWTEYIRQALRVNGAPGSPFGAVASGVKVHEFGRWMTRKLYQQSSSAFPAAKYCYEYNEGGGTWWLPSMFELGELMIDEHLDKVNENSLSGWSYVSAGSDRWSCVCYSSGVAWFYSGYGMSSYNGFADYQLTVRPVTLLKLV